MTSRPMRLSSASSSRYPDAPGLLGQCPMSIAIFANVPSLDVAAQDLPRAALVVPEDEAYAANCIWVNGTVLVPAGYPTVLARIQEAGYRTITVDVSEFRKLDGGLSCLSLRF